MSKYFSLIIIAIFAIYLSACKTEFNPNADYKDITVVYGLLNQSDTFTYIKINKAFLGNASAYVMAQDEDLSSYGSDIEVKIEEYLNGGISNVFYFDTTTVYNKETGVFYAPKQVLYRYHTLNLLKEGRDYKLTIRNKKSGKIINAQTALVGGFNIKTPASWQNIIDFSTAGKSKVEWTSASGGKRYQVNMRVNYYESLNDTSHYQSKYLDMNLGTQKRATFEGGMLMSMEYINLTIYETLKNNLKWSTLQAPIYRKSGKVEYLISVATDDLSTYIDVNEPSNTIVQVRPEFTNISNGIGVFSARYNNAIDNPRKIDMGSKSRTILQEQYPMLGF
ncbi:MAG: hypothetical protein WCO13_12860 [Bacteroidota bacterium]